MMSESKKPIDAPEKRQPWEPPALKAVGSIAEVLQSGGGKPSLAPGDPGEPRKVTSQG
jgi:hypothetical protein